MCQFKSAIVLKNGDIIHSYYTDSHEDLVDMMELRDNGNGGFVRVEFFPRENNYADVSAYKLSVDQPDTPDWWTDEMAKRTETFLREVVKRMIVRENKKCLVGGAYILAGNAQIERCVDANIVVMYDSSNVGKMRGSSKVGEMCNSSKVGEMWGSSKVGEMWDSSKVGEMYDSSKVGEMWDSSKVGEMWDSSKVGEMYDSSKVEIDKRVKEGN
jgi:hypothetical protein